MGYDAFIPDTVCVPGTGAWTKTLKYHQRCLKHSDCLPCYTLSETLVIEVRKRKQSLKIFSTCGFFSFY